MNDQPPKKAYTMEENIKYISFGIKDLVKAVNELTDVIRRLQKEEPSKF